MFRAGGCVDYFSLMLLFDAFCEASVDNVADFLVDADIVVRELAQQPQHQGSPSPLWYGA